jgi:phage tail sheath protein FI
MPEYLTPGVYIEEIERGPRPIEGVPTSTSAFLGQTERGAIKPRLVTSYKDFQRWFGGVFGDGKFLPYAVNGFFENGGKRLYLCRLAGKQVTAASAAFGNFTVMAVGPGAWGRRIWARIDDSSTKAPDAAGAAQPIGFRLRLAYWASDPPNGLFDPFDPQNELARRRSPPAAEEDFDDLVVDPASPDYFEKRLVDSAGFVNSALATVVRQPAAAANELPQKNTQALAQDGTDDPNPLDGADYEGHLAGTTRTQLQGLAALETDPYREVSLVYAPAAGVDVVKKLISHCERMRFRFAAIDCDKASNAGGLDPRTTIQDTQYAAFYYPWIWISDPQSGARRLVPPSGHALGIYARVDSERGVFKAPANETVRGALALETDITDETQGVLNPRGVNAIRSFPGRGIRVWGARTLSSNALWKYVSVRRLFIFLERSIYEGTQWVVFEPNDPRLWARVTDTIRLFLRGQWRLGALFGRTEEQAFFVTCDETTMTQDDILNGRLICEIGIAPVRPAEFVIFRIFQHTAEAQR